MKKIGFIDYCIDEWHANNYPAWIKEACERLGADYTVAYAWAEKNTEGGLTTEEWCEKFGAESCESIEEIAKKSDCLIILSPSNPEKHLPYAREALKVGKRTYIDKTFAPSYAEAKEIFDIAEKYGTEIFSSSALRYASELSEAKVAKNLIITGGGSNLPEYIIHQIEQVVTVFGVGAETVRAEEQGKQKLISVTYKDGKKATMIFFSSLPFTLCHDGENDGYTPVSSPFFNGLVADIIGFFETGRHNPSREETLEIMRIRDAVLKAVNAPGESFTLA